MTTVADVLASLGGTIRPDAAAVWDPVGLQIGGVDAEVASIAVCHEVTEAVVDAIEEAPVDLLVTYHPVLFGLVNRLLDGRSQVARAMRLLRADVNVVVAHTDFDAAPGGAADSLAAALGLADPVPFGADDFEGLTDIGRVGGFQGTLGALADLVATVLGSSSQRVSGDPAQTMSRVAVVPGSGSGFIPEASTLADVLVTGDVGHHKAVAARDGDLSVIDPGHIATERPGLAALVAMTRTLTGMDVVDLTHLDPQTWV